ncbi:MAG: DNA repair protein RecN [Crocinitomicaceae bacterium]|nr:DNA repair protein RecN [Crocinitomicaceae bacterium]
MLVQINIQNFALIAAAELNFQPEFTVITGETGSGKSILLGALNLILGERADYGVIRNQAEKTAVEATFHIQGFGLESFFETHDLDYSEETIIRREISSQGKSRAFVNDTPVQLTILKELSEKLVHIHSQHDTLALKNNQFQMELLDVLADNTTLRASFKKTFSDWKKLTKKLADLKASYAKIVQEADYNQFQWEELNQLNLDQISYSNMETELNAVENMEEIKAGFASIVQYIGEERGITDLLSLLKSNLDKVKQLHPNLQSLSERIIATLIELKDISEEAEGQIETLEVDPKKQMELLEKMDQYNRVILKHQVKTQEDLILIFKELSNGQSNAENIEADIIQLEKEVEVLETKVQQGAKDLHDRRISNGPKVAKQLEEILTELKLENSVLKFDLEQLDKIDETGFSKLTLLFSPNMGMTPKPIEKAASGGELSRFMLALQLLLSAKKQLPTLLFDEIDTGVSGEVAQKIGNVLKRMGQQMQVLAITHLPQVAGKGTHHWKVEKTQSSDKTLTQVTVLTEAERVQEIARLMSGENINEAALANARALMN